MDITNPNWIPPEPKTYTWTLTYKGETYSSDDEVCNLYELWENAEIGYLELFDQFGIDYPTDEDEIEELYDEVEFGCEENED